MPIPDIKADRIKGQVADGVERPKAVNRFEIGENVRVANGPFVSFNGEVGKPTNPGRGLKSLCPSSAALRWSTSNTIRARRSDCAVLATPQETAKRALPRYLLETHTAAIRSAWLPGLRRIAFRAYSAAVWERLEPSTNWRKGAK
jgi:hypothetical protein